MKKKRSSDDLYFKKIFLKEEFHGDRLINNVRFFLVLLFFLIKAIKTKMFTSAFVFSPGVKITFILLFIAMTYTIIIFFLYQKNIYTPIIKYLSITIDITLIVIALFAYKFEPFSEYGKIFSLARFSIIYLFIILSIIRFNIKLSIYAGLIAGAEYLFLVVLNNDILNIPFHFRAPDGNIYTSMFTPTEEYLKISYLFLAGIVTGLVSLKLRSLVITSVGQEQEKQQLFLEKQIIETTNNENKKYLDNINEGLLLVDKNFNICQQYSGFLEKLFMTDQISGKNFIDFVYPDPQEFANDRQELKDYMELLFYNNTADPEMLEEINPLMNHTLLIRDSKGNLNEKIVNARFARIEKENHLENIMVIFEDITKIIKSKNTIEEIKNQHQNEIEVISEILRIGPDSFIEFTTETIDTIKEFNQNLDQLDDDQILNQTFRMMHSLKGSAKIFKFDYISAVANSIEDLLSDIREKRCPLDQHLKKEIKKHIKKLESAIQSINQLNDKFKHFSRIYIESQEDKSKYQLDRFIESITEMVLTLSKQLNKKINFSVNKKVEHFPYLSDLKNPIIHLIRNAIDHGIEDTFERLSYNKSEEGKIELNFTQIDQNYLLEISDDGEGINFELIREKGIMKKKLPENKEVSKSDLLNLVFSPNFTSKERATDISGRGVGLDIVKNTSDQLGGKISVSTKRHYGTKITIKIPI
ncbi:MAG: ATP-binding protein [Spirochaetes bacterium]|nr:ATP-binding protein [Spirochaetota bacterium]